MRCMARSLAFLFIRPGTVFNYSASHSPVRYDCRRDLIVIDEAAEDCALSTRRETAQRSPENSTSDGHVGLDSLFPHR